jgi:hypothetical protein
MMLAAMANRTSFDPLGAGAMLLGVLFACVGIGALVGWKAGSTGVGIAVGSVVGIPAAILAVYGVYGRAF